MHKIPVFSTYDFLSAGGDHRDILVKRVMYGLETIAQYAQDNEHILVVSHGRQL